MYAHVFYSLLGILVMEKISVARHHAPRRIFATLTILCGVAIGALGCRADNRTRSADSAHAGGTAAAAAATSDRPCAGDNGGLTLPTGFCATVFADDIGHARHVAVTSNGDVYVNTWSGRYYGGDKGPPDGFLVALRDTNRDGRADIVTHFGSKPATRGTGGTGIALHAGSLYAEEGSRIVRYALREGVLVPTGDPETIVDGLPLSGDHPMHPFAIDTAGNMYVDLGSASNACQIKNRVPESPGHKPCAELRTRAGIWKFDASRTGQRFSPAARYATGIRNAVGIAIGPDGRVYATQHGRDQLAENWSKLYTTEQGQNLPAEELLLMEQGADYGWPECYFDNEQQKLVLAPEYGGDGGKAVGDCATKRAPIAVFPAHWAPDGLLFYTGQSFPSRYRSGAFIAFHGSWNRAPGPQGGYQVVFQPLSSDQASTRFETFANGFAGGVLEPDAAKHRPVGLGQGPDGALYIADDKTGRVWRIVYSSERK
jgi:glucose/arabinose dehydrogenase